MRIKRLTSINVLAVVLAIIMAGTAAAAPPAAPAGLAQYRADGTTAITQGGTTDQATVRVKATVTDADSTVQLQVEIMDSTGGPFSDTPNCVSDFVTSLSVATASCSGLSVGTAYKWQARTNDGTATSAWVAYDVSDPDVTVASNFLIHNSANLGVASYGAWGVSGGTYGEFVCETCHIMSTTNIKRVRTTIDSPDASNWPSGGSTTGAIVFTQADGTNSDMGDTAGPFNGVCNVCHNTVAADHVHYTYNSSDATHNVGADCTACHQHRQAFKGLDCNGCHGISGSTGAPLVNGDLVGVQDTYYPITGQTVGAHPKHVTDQGITDCTVCHNLNGMPTVDEVLTIAFSGTATVNSSVPTYDGTALDAPYSYNGGVTTLTGTLDCTNVYCHSSVQGAGGLGVPASYATSDWVGGALTCDTCHGQDADETDGQPDSGAHSVHAGSQAGEMNYNCSECHTGAGSGTTVHADGTIQMGLSGGGTYSQGDNAPNNDYGTCSTVDCHSDGKSSPSYASPAWGDTADCVFCHGGSGGSTGGALTALTASHAVHTGAGMGYTCDNCHATTASDNSTIIDYTRHDNAAANVAVAAAIGGTGTDGGDYTAGSCATINCHGTASADWTSGGTTGDCSLCHGMAANPADGRDTNGDTAASDTEVGAHVAHLNNTHGLRSTGIACNECHTEPAGGTYADKINALGHIDTALPSEVPLAGTLANTNTATPLYGGAPGGTCATTYCHDGTKIKNGWSTAGQIEFATPDWNTPIMNGTIDDCDNCHGNPPAAPHTTSTACSGCHTHVDATQFGFSDVSLHMDGAVIAQAGGSCDSCHAYPPAISDGKSYVQVNGSPPSALEGKGGNPTNSDVHMIHVTSIRNERIARGLGDPGALDAASDAFGDGKTTILCGACHDMAAANHDIDGNGTRVINFNGSAQYEFINTLGVTYNGVPGVSSGTTPKTCSNISCHFGGTPIWQDTGEAGN